MGTSNYGSKSLKIWMASDEQTDAIDKKYILALNKNKTNSRIINVFIVML